MKLRTRLYLWVSSLFVLFFVFAYFIEIYLVNSHLKNTENAMENEIRRISEGKRQDFEEFLGIQIADIQAEIDALLYRIDEYSYLKSGFEPSEKNKAGKTWPAASTLLLHYKWINYIQNTINDEVCSLLIPSAQDLRPIRYYKINDDLSWILLKEEDESPYIGIRLSLRDISGLTSSLVDIDVGKFTNIYFFFNWKGLKDFEIKGPLNVEGFTYSDPGYVSDQTDKLSELRSGLLKKIQAAQSYIKTLPTEKLESFTNNQLRDYIQSHHPAPLSLEGNQDNIPLSVIQKAEKGSTDLIDMEFIRTFYKTRDRDDAVVLVWALTSALATDLFGSDPLAPGAPAGVATILPDKEVASAILAKGTFYNKPFYNDRAYEKDQAVNPNDSLIPSSIALINDPQENELFIGNLLSIKDNGNTSLITIAVKISNLLQQVALASNQTVSLVNKNKVVTVFNAEGEQQKDSPFQHLPLDQMKEKKGTIVVDGDEYYYLHLQPYENIDLHFYLFELKTKAFALVTFIQTQLSDVISELSWNMRSIAVAAMFFALVILEFISRKITKPITRLAKATLPVSEGHFEDVDIPKVPNAKHDEIAILCNSFVEMIQGLKDREKVKGVLNKVVSKEIAAEILNGNISLGGEEKQATIVFADIRKFTHLTEKMNPQDVIRLLNSAMTKISHEVDLFGGVIDKYVGDEAMALYGAPVTQEDHAKRACLSALQMMEKIEAWNVEREKEGLLPVHIGIGICTGEVVAGNMGAENRLNYTVLGSNVNLGARLCSLAKEQEILVTKNTIDGLGVKDAIVYEEVGPVELKGFSEPIQVFKITGIKNP